MGRLVVVVGVGLVAIEQMEVGTQHKGALVAAAVHEMGDGAVGYAWGALDVEGQMQEEQWQARQSGRGNCWVEAVGDAGCAEAPQSSATVR